MKRKVNINRPEISADEINRRRDFDSVLKNSTGAGGKPFFKNPWFLSGVVAVTVAVVTGVLLLNRNETGQVASQNTTQASDADTAGLAAFYKAEEAKSCIAPPIAGLDIPYTSYKVNPGKGGTFDFKTGSTFTVPQNAFVDENGKPVKGEVELRYREFHDAADFFVAGIPMTYDSAGVKYQFESAGMIEMLAYQDGKPVNMAPGKTIRIEMASEQEGTQYNLYELDTLKNNWSCLGKDKVVAPGESKKGGKPDLQNDLASKAEALPEYKALESKKEVALEEKETKIAALPKLAPEPKKPVKVNKDKYTVNIDINLADFPEFTTFKNVQWELGAENKMTSGMWTDLNKTEWEDATIKEGTKKGENYYLSLKKGTKKISNLVVNPVFEGKNYETAMADFQDKFSKYASALDKRKEEERRIEEKYLADVAALKKQQEALAAEWKRKAEEQESNLSTEQKVMRSFTISKFGVFNCDNPSVYPKGMTCSVALVNEKDKPLRCYDIYLVDKKINGLFTYYKNPVATFSFNPNSSNLLWTVENGVLYYISQDQFMELRSGSHSVRMTRVDRKFETVDDMKAFFNI